MGILHSTGWGLCLAALAGCAALQAQAPAPGCRDTLAAPTTDTIPLTVALRTHTLDPVFDFAESYQQMFGEGVRQYLRLPVPLQLDTYATERDMNGVERVAHFTLEVALRATMRRNGRIENARVTGGTRNAGFEAALLAAITSLDTSGALPPIPETILPGADTIPISLTILTNDSRTRLETGVEVPLFEFKAPLRPVSRVLTLNPRTSSLGYPPSLRASGVSGRVVLSYVVREDGLVDMESIVAWKADHRDFLRAVLMALPSFRFTPLELAGCKVTQMTREPFRFDAEP